ncbi:hypothetical protein AAMO2058_000435400 [Amorphochlora amoebiformis]
MKLQKTRSKWAAKVQRVHKKEEEVQIDLIDMRKYPSVDRRVGSYKWILTMKNVRTKFQALSPLSSKDADEVVHVFFNMWVKLGCSSRVRFDKGKEFCNTLMRNLASALNVKFESNRMPGNPNATGSIERPNSEIKRLLSQAMLDCQTQQWHLLLGFVEMAFNSRYRPNIKVSPVEYQLGHRFPCRLQGSDSLRRFMAVYAPAFLPKTTNRKGHSTNISAEIIANLQKDMDNPVDEDLEEAIEALESAIQDFESKKASLIQSVQIAFANDDFDAVARLGSQMTTVNEEKNKLQEQRQVLLDKRTKLLNSPHPKLDTVSLLYDYNIIGMDSHPNTNGVQEGSNLNGDQKGANHVAPNITDIDKFLMDSDSDDSVNGTMDAAHDDVEHTMKKKHNLQSTQVKSSNTLFTKSRDQNSKSNSPTSKTPSLTTKAQISKSRGQISKSLTDDYFKEVLNPRNAFRFDKDFPLPPSYDDESNPLGDYHRMLVDIHDHHNAHFIPCGVSKRRWASDITVGNALYEIVGVLNKSPGVSLDVVTGMTSHILSRKDWKDSVSKKIIAPFEKDGTTTIRGYIVNINKNHWIKMSLSRCKNHPNGCASIWDPLSSPSISKVRTSETGQLVAALRKGGISVTVVPHRVQYDHYLCGYFCVFLIMKDMAQRCVPGPGFSVEDCCMNNTPSVKPLVLNPAKRSIQKANTEHVTRFRELIRRLCIKRIIDKGTLAFNGMDDIDIAISLSMMNKPTAIAHKSKKLTASEAKSHADFQRLKEKIEKMAAKNDEVFTGSKTVSYIDITSDINVVQELTISRDSNGNINATMSDVSRRLAFVKSERSEALQSHTKPEDHNKKTEGARQDITTPICQQKHECSGPQESIQPRPSSSTSRPQRELTSMASSPAVRKFEALCKLISKDMSSQSEDEKLRTTKLMKNVKLLLYYGDRPKLKKLVRNVASLVPDGKLKRNNYRVHNYSSRIYLMNLVLQLYTNKHMNQHGKLVAEEFINTAALSHSATNLSHPK